MLEPGDMLYVPPGVSHNGIALGDDCMTLSIGFRAPSRAELIGDWSDHLLEELSDDDRYADPGLALQANPGEISADALANLRAMMIEALGDEQRFARWFGAYSSTRKYPDVDWRPEAPLDLDDIRDAIAQGLELQRNPASRFAFVREGGDALVLFVDGETFACSKDTSALAEMICANDSLTVDVMSDAACELLLTLCNMGSLAFVDEDDDA